MKGKKVGITLHALMSSTRLTKKPMRMLCGREMIAHQIDRLKTAKVPEGIVLCTSTADHDRVLLDMAKKEGIESFAGPKDDLMMRLTMAAEKYGFDYIIAPAGDNPLTDAEHIDILARHMVENELDYGDSVGVLPIGLFAKAAKTSALKKACEIKEETDTGSYMNYFIMTKGLFKTGKIKALPWVIGTDFRLTVDMPEDFKLMENIFERFYTPGGVFPLADVLVYLRNNPGVMDINRKITQIPIESFPFRLKKGYEKFILKEYRTDFKTAGYR